MALSDSMFLFEITLEELISFVKCQEFSIICQFGDIFKICLNDPNEKKTYGPKRLKKKLAKKIQVRGPKLKTEKMLTEPLVTIGQSVLIANTAESLLISMINYPLEISLCSKIHPEYGLGSTEIPWSKTFMDYLRDINNIQNLSFVTVDGKYNVFDEITSKRMAIINLKIKLSRLENKISTEFRTHSQLGQQNFTSIKSSSTAILDTLKEKKCDFGDETGLIKTIYSGGKTKPKRSCVNKIEMAKKIDEKNYETMHIENKRIQQFNYCKNIIDLIKSETNLKIDRQLSLIKCKSLSSLKQGSPIKPFNYIFGEPKGPLGNQVIYVGYFTVQNLSEKPQSSTSSKDSIKVSNSTGKANDAEEKYTLKLCGDECRSKKGSTVCSLSHCSLNLPRDAAHLINIRKCENIDCNSKKYRETTSPSDDKVLIDLTSIKHQCCDFPEKIEQVVGGIKAEIKIGETPCFCSCECTFGFTKKTTYCNICGGYELVGEELSQTQGKQPPLPCPIFHKLVDKNKLKTCSSGSDTKKRGDGSQKSLKQGSRSEKRSLAGDKSGESEKDNKKGKKKKKDDRFKFNYGYQAPQIGHSQCAMPCTGTMGAVPKHMGWLWTAEDIPGMKFRPMWRPGATNKHVVRLLRMARNPGQVIAKKRRKDVKKRPLKRPLLVVQKQDGEYIVTMETMKAYLKPRAFNQQPFEDKPVVTYTIGRSEEENRVRRKKKERVQRRLERAQRDFIQSAFKDMCKEICLKTYQQALGILTDAEDPECACYPAEPGPDRTNLDISCSCSEDSLSLDSDTDSDEWIVEFTPPNALFDPTYKGKKIQKVDNGTQYTYLDYKVKLFDRYGNPVPRFFKGPDGKQQCSDLGGFWSPDHKWLGINVDGIIAPDNRWAPNNFIGPNGEQVNVEAGKFQAANGKWLILGVDGYVDCNGKWRFYSRPRKSPTHNKKRTTSKKGDRKDVTIPVTQQSETNWSCFGDASPKDLSKMGIVGHGFDRKLLAVTLKEMLARGEDVKIPEPSVVPRRLEPKRGKRARLPESNVYGSRTHYAERTQCKHSIPSEKGVVAVDARGNKVYFKLKDYTNKRPNERLVTLNKQGISLSSFHLPCLHSFISSELMKQQQRERLISLSTQGKSVATQV